jgi:hypothetical protein
MNERKKVGKKERKKEGNKEGKKEGKKIVLITRGLLTTVLSKEQPSPQLT